MPSTKHVVTFRMSDPQLAVVDAAATVARLPRSEYIRRALLGHEPTAHRPLPPAKVVSLGGSTYGAPWPGPLA